ncbi:MAG TPA: aldo/keto reductase [Dehalococcoidia bacterium]|nr:aldo/keto reductase [Dehalococcoidia bacterium]
MEQRDFGRTGLRVSALGFGCGNVGGLMVRGSHEQQVAAVRRALDAGITYFDTAAMYGDGLSETHLGSVLSELGAWDRVVVGTKVRLKPEQLREPAKGARESLVASLQRLGRDSVDLLQLHNTLSGDVDASGRSVAASQLDEIAAGMRALVDEGLVRHIGFTGVGETEALHENARSGRFETMQSYFNAINPSAGHAGKHGPGQDMAGVIDVAARAGLGVIAIRVMAGGAMTGQEQRATLASTGLGPALVPGDTYEVDISRAVWLGSLAGDLGLESALELSFRLVTAHRGVSTALVGFSDMDQLESAIRWAERGPLSADQVSRALEAV